MPRQVVVPKSSAPQRRRPSVAKRYHGALLALVLSVWLWSGLAPHDTRLTWTLETLPVMVALPLVLLTYRSLPLTSLTYTLATLHALVLMLGGHYSYAKVPLGFWMQDWFGWTRNNYDKIGHLMQGFAPVIYTREVLLRKTPLRPGKMLAFLSLSVPLAASAMYEIFEWLASLSDPTDTEAFLGTQGYIWDTQTDMFLCLVGSVVGLAVLARWHDRCLAGVLPPSS